MWLARFFHIIITIIAVMYLLSLLIIGVCLQVHSHKNYKGRKRIIVRYKETILIIMYKSTVCPSRSKANLGFRSRIVKKLHCTFFFIYSLYVHVCYKIVSTNVHISYLWVQIEKGFAESTDCKGNDNNIIIIIIIAMPHTWIKTSTVMIY
jgi:hypothetical protein